MFSPTRTLLAGALRKCRALGKEVSPLSRLRQELLHEVDRNGDGSIDFEESQRMRPKGETRRGSPIPPIKT